MRVFEKNIQTRQNRTGVIREINGIKASKGKNDPGNQLMNVSQQDDTQAKQKLNIFDE